MNLLYVGDLWRGSTALHRCNALKELGGRVQVIDSSLGKYSIKFNNFLIKHFRYRYDFGEIGNKILTHLNEKVRILWLDKANYLNRKQIELIKDQYPRLYIVFYSPDDYLHKYHLTKQLITALPYYDCIVTTKSYNVNELYQFGVKRVILVNNAYDPSIHRPVALSDKEYSLYSSDILFIGGYEKERSASILKLANSGLNVSVYGGNWDKVKNPPSNLRIINKWFFEHDYVKIINASKICLNFLRKINRDLQTTRSIEIPACGVFMLSEWSHEHEELFKDKSEAVFFRDDNELISLANYYLNNEEERITIAKNGLLRCINSGYSNYATLAKVLKQLANED